MGPNPYIRMVSLGRGPGVRMKLMYRRCVGCFADKAASGRRMQDLYTAFYRLQVAAWLFRALQENRSLSDLQQIQKCLPGGAACTLAMARANAHDFVVGLPLGYAVWIANAST